MKWTLGGGTKALCERQWKDQWEAGESVGGGARWPFCPSGGWRALLVLHSPKSAEVGAWVLSPAGVTEPHPVKLGGSLRLLLARRLRLPGKLWLSWQRLVYHAAD